METDEDQRVLPFQLQFDKPLASQIKIAEWNPVKDLLAMVTDDSKILLHRFNWQRLWTISPGKCVTALCWRPDGKAIAVGLEDGTVSLHDVENGKLLRSAKSHVAAVVCLHWVQDSQLIGHESSNISAYEDRTARFLPPAPRVPRIPGLVSGDIGFMDDTNDSFGEFSNSSHQHFNILCSGDKDGSICFSIFGIFPIGNVNIHNLHVCTPSTGNQDAYRLLNASIYKVALSKDLCRLIVMCSGELVESGAESIERKMAEHSVLGLHSLVLDTSIFWKRKNELLQIAQQASNIEDMNEIIRVSLSIMCKQWSDAMHTFSEKFSSLSTLIIDHGMDSSPQEEFLSLLCGARISPPIHQFLVSSLGDVVVKRVSKAVNNAVKELQLIVHDHLQPAAEIIGFRIGEIRGLSRWRARYKGIGLDETLTNDATEKAGMFLVQVERFMRVLSSVGQQFSNFFNWLLKSIRLLMSEPSDQLPPYSSELVVIFLKYLYDHDPVRQLLELSEVDHNIEIDLETMQRVKELVKFGGFSDFNYLQRTLAKEFQQMESSFKDVFLMPFTAISKKIICENFVPLFPFSSSWVPRSINVPTSISYYKDASVATSSCEAYQDTFIDYISFGILDDSISDIPNCIGIARGFIWDFSSMKKGYISLEAVLICVPKGYECMDLSLYKETQIVLLLNEITASSESSGNAYMMIVQANDLPFVSVSKSIGLGSWKLQELKDSVVYLNMENEKVRNIPHSVVFPLAVSASRGLACVFAARKRALVYILDENEDEEEEVSDEE